jgi:glycosyltransferase involved in cell wall biosynthesis
MGSVVVFDAIAARYGGGAYAAAQIARTLALRDDVERVVVVTRRGSIVAQALAGASGVRLHELPARGRGELALRLVWEAVSLPALVQRERAGSLITMTALPVRVRGARLVCVFANPVMYETDTAANRLRRAATRRTTARAHHLAAPSGTMADLVASLAGRPCEVVPFGVDHDRFRPPERAGGSIVCVADFYAHKRHDLLLDAWEGMRPPRPPLVLIGDAAVDPVTSARVRERVAELPERGSIVVEHRVPLGRLLRAYAEARVFAMPSERESFCMPLAEAMACGVPAAARDIPSLRETGGAGARFVAGSEAGAWTSALQSLFDDDGEHERLRAAAIESAARFSWERCAAQIAEHL